MALLFGTIVLGGCTNDLDSDKIGPNADGTVDCIVIPFASAQDDIVVQTRAQNLDDLNENRVRNLYVFLFDGKGNKVYAKYFDSSNKVTNVDASEDDCWSVVNTSKTSDNRTQGEIKIHTTANEAETYKLYAITNLDSSFVDISSDRLSQIQTETELLRTKGTMLQQTVSRSGYLQMSGSLLNVHIDTHGEITDGTNPVTLHLFHMDAKVQVTLKQGTAVKSLTNASIQVINLPRVGYVWSPYSYTGENYDTTTTGLDAVTSVADTFDGPKAGFDNISQKTIGGVPYTTCEAWFYMLESRQTPKKAIPMTCPDAGWENFDSEKINYNPYFERARQTKDTSMSPLEPGYGLNVLDANGDRDFVYANNLSPYMLVKCSIAMDLIDDAAGQELGGDVTYIIPLGDAGSSASPVEAKVNNFNTNRNTFYHYTITVNGVHNIRVEVDARAEAISSGGFQPEENQPGALGQVVVAKEEIAICDCHYESRTLTFHANNVSQNLTWHVNTPFGEGGPEVDIDGNDIIPPGLDYEWVTFRVNKLASGKNVDDDDVDKAADDYRYSVNRQKYEPGKTMNVSELVKYMKEQQKIYSTEDPDNPATWTSDFDNGKMVDVDDIDGDGNTTEIVDDPHKRKICVTAYINEFYYDYNPLNPIEDIPADFWKQYVNWPTDRYMYILSESNLSRDQESRATGSVVTIQQHPIQSIFDTNPSNTTFSTAWGLEITDEDEGKLNKKYTSESDSPDRGNDDKYNGRLNTMKEWGLVNKAGTTYNTSASWSTYLKEEVPNNLPQLNDAYKYIRYSCMNRNRDNDGDNKIDQDEVRWYMAAIKQLTGIAVGRDVLLPESRLYKRTSEDKILDDPNKWRQHVVSSTMFDDNSNQPTVIWGEEITSISDLANSTNYGSHGSYTFNTWSVRCVRNLGTKNETLDAGYVLTEEPDDYIDVKTDGKTHQVTCVRINPQALRAQQDTELVFCDENGEQARLSKRFYISADVISSLPSLPAGYNLDHDFLNHNQWIEDVGSSGPTSSGGTGHCPEGYRIPNMLELTIIFNYADDLNKQLQDLGKPTITWSENHYFSRNYYSFGMYGAYKKTSEAAKPGWMVGDKTITIQNSISKVRCVRDASVEELQAEGLL